jgi:hypothetical protein
MEITLGLSRPLPASQADDKRSADKHRIRLHLSDQLRELWETDAFLRVVMGEQRFEEAILERRRLQPTRLHRSHASRACRRAAIGRWRSRIRSMA